MQETDNPGPKPVKFRFRNIGPVKDAELELGDLTVIAGRNNTGKTYIAYTLYGFLSMSRIFPNWRYTPEKKQPEAEFPNWDHVADQLAESGTYTFPLDHEEFDAQRKRMTQLLTQAFSGQGLSDMFNSQHEVFEGASIQIIWNGERSRLQHSYKSKDSKVSIEYDGTEAVMTVDNSERQLPTNQLAGSAATHYVRFLFDSVFPDPFILSSERFGISLFYRELDFTKNQLVDLLQKMSDKKNRDMFSPYRFIDQATSRYALPIKDNIDYTRSIPDLRGRKSKIYSSKLFDDIKDMMGGYYGAAGDDIRFISKARGKGRSFNLPLHLASSSVRGLSDLYFFLRHVAGSNHLLIIDEPESHLDTANQIRLARLLARFVKGGLKVLITTHSDYLIKEINNLVMLSRPFADKGSVIGKLKYRADDFLEPESVRAYVAENNGLSKCDVDGFGMNMPVFDETIDAINNAANELASRMEEDSGE